MYKQFWSWLSRVNKNHPPCFGVSKIQGERKRHTNVVFIEVTPKHRGIEWRGVLRSSSHLLWSVSLRAPTRHAVVQADRMV